MLGATLVACALGLDYHLPEASLSASYKELKGWKVATPRDHGNRGAWWSVYHDPTLDSLEQQKDVSKQTIAAAEAAFRQAAALVQQARAALFPTGGLVYDPTRLYEGPGATCTGVRSSRAMQQVEDQLSNLRILAQQQRVQDEAVALSRRAVEITLNEYRAGTVSFTTVVTAQATLLTNEQAAPSA